MPKTWTTEEILAYARNKAAVDDTGAAGFTDADVLGYVNNELLTTVVPRIMQERERYFIVTEELALVAGQRDYRIPNRAMGVKLDDVRLVVDGKPRGQLEHIATGTIEARGDDTNQGTPTGFWLDGVYIVVWPISNGLGVLRVPYFFRPGELVKASAYRRVAAVNSATSLTLTSTIPTGWTTANKFDIHSQHSGAEIKSWSLPASTVSGTTLTATLALDGSRVGTHAVEVGDYVCLEGEAAVPALPRELHSIVGDLAAVCLLEALGDAEAVQLQQALVERRLARIEPFVSDRAESSPRVIRGAAGIALFGQGCWYF